MIVSDLNSIIYCSYRDLEIATVTVERDPSFIETMLEREKEFYRCMLEKEPYSLGYVENDLVDDLFQKLQTFRAEKREMIRVLEENEEKIKQAILALIGEKETKTFKTTIRKIFRTTYDYKKMAEDYKCELEPYKKESFFWDFKETK